MKRRIVIALVIPGVIHAAASQEAGPVELARTGEFLGDGPFPKSASDWFAVVRTESGLGLFKTSLEVSEVSHACTGTATKFAASTPDDILFLVRGSPLFREGTLDSSFNGYKFVPANTNRISLSLKSGLQFGFFARGTPTPVRFTSAERQFTNYELLMWQGAKTQSIATFPTLGETGPTLLWAGDLDRDGKPDALLDLHSGYSSRYSLLLSSAATPQQLVLNVASFPINAC